MNQKTTETTLGSKSSPVGLIAGGGDFPLRVQQAVRTSGRDIVTIGLEGACDASLETDLILKIDKMSTAVIFFKKHDCEQLIIIGHAQRPNLMQLRPDMGGLKVLKRIMMHRHRGDNVLLKEISRYFEEQGFELLAAQTILGKLLTPQGILTRITPTDIDQQDIAQGIDVTREIGRLDIGQASVVCRGQVLAVEGVDGTDALLKRVLDLDENLRGTVKQRQGVLVKLPKPGQECHIDWPALGLTTIENALTAGLAGIVFEEQGALINDLDACIRLADKNGIFLMGIPALEEV